MAQQYIAPGKQGKGTKPNAKPLTVTPVTKPSVTPKPIVQRPLGGPGTQQRPTAITPQSVGQQVYNSVTQPLDFSGNQRVTSPDPVAPGASPVDVPNSPQLGNTFSAAQLAQLKALQAPRRTRIPIANVAPGPRYTFDPESGRYFTAPGQDFREDGQSLEDATFQRGLNSLDPVFQRERKALETRLVNQGLPIGSEAYNEALDRFDRSKGAQLENLALSSVGAGRQEQGRLFGQALAGRQFDANEAARQFGERLTGTRFNAGESARNFAERMANAQFGFNQQQFNANQGALNFQQQLAANQQNFGQDFQRAQLAAQENARRYAQNLGTNQYNAGLAQQQFTNQLANQGILDQNARFQAQQQAGQFQRDLALRNQQIREQQLLRQQPFNDLSQILSLAGQVQNPQFQGTAQYGPQQVNYGGLAQNQYLGELDAYNQRRASTLGLLGGVGSAFIPFLPFGGGG